MRKGTTIAATGLVALLGGCEFLGFRIGPQPEPKLYAAHWDQPLPLNTDAVPSSKQPLEDISQALKAYVYADYERRIQGARGVPVNADLSDQEDALASVLGVYGYGDQVKDVVGRRNAHRLAAYFQSHGYIFRAITIGGEDGSFELRKIIKREPVTRTIMGAEASFDLVTYADPVIMNIWDYMAVKEDGQPVIPANTYSADQVDYFPSHDNPMAKQWYKDMQAAYDRTVEGMDRSLDQLIEGMGAEPAFFFIMGRRCHVKGVGSIYENARSEDDFVEKINKVWKEQTIIHEGMHTIDHSPWPAGCTMRYLLELKSHKEARSFLAEMHEANAWLALGKCYKLLVDPEKDVGPLNEHAHAAKLILWNLAAYITRHQEQFENVDFADFKKEQSILHILKQGHKLTEDQLRAAAKWIFDELYQGKAVDDWLKESFAARGIPIRQR